MSDSCPALPHFMIAAMVKVKFRYHFISVLTLFLVDYGFISLKIEQKSPLKTVAVILSHKTWVIIVFHIF